MSTCYDGADGYGDSDMIVEVEHPPDTGLDGVGQPQIVYSQAGQEHRPQGPVSMHARGVGMCGVLHITARDAGYLAFFT